MSTIVDTPKNSPRKSILHFVVGGLSGAFATSIVQPIDTLKVQIQVISEQQGKHNNTNKRSFFNLFKTIYRQKGIAIFYRGLDSAISRQICYTSVRLGSYTWGVDKLKRNGTQINTPLKILLSSISGIFGAIVGNPFDVALIRRQVTVSTGQKAYLNTYDAFKSIIKQEGFSKLWRAVDITMLRVLLINIGQLAGYEIITQATYPYMMNTNKLTHQNISAILTAIVTAFIALPVDNIKVKLQKQTPETIMYKNISNCFAKTIQLQGFFRLWVGFPVYLLRSMPHSFILIRTQQYLKQRFIDNQTEA